MGQRKILAFPSIAKGILDFKQHFRFTIFLDKRL